MDKLLSLLYIIWWGFCVYRVHEVLKRQDNGYTGFLTVSGALIFGTLFAGLPVIAGVAIFVNI